MLFSQVFFSCTYEVEEDLMTKQNEQTENVMTKQNEQANDWGDDAITDEDEDGN